MKKSGFFKQDSEQSRRHYLGAEALPDGKTSFLIFAALAFGLWLDRFSPLWGQIAAGLLFWGLFVVLYNRMDQTSRRLMMAGLIIAFLGEIFCSLIWQLYDYRLYNIPHYVPPGHLLVFLLGSAIATKIPRWTVWLVPGFAVIYALAGQLSGIDEFALILVAMFLACLICEEDRRLYSTMFVLCLVLEIYGTWLGNWTWKPVVPLWEISTINPPPASGAFYCVLDFLMLRLMLAGGRSSALSAELFLRLRQYVADLGTPPPEMELVPEKIENPDHRRVRY